MLYFIESLTGRSLHITPFLTLAYAYARVLSHRRMVLVRTPRNAYVFHRGQWLRP